MKLIKTTSINQDTGIGFFFVRFLSNILIITSSLTFGVFHQIRTFFLSFFFCFSRQIVVPTWSSYTSICFEAWRFWRHWTYWPYFGKTKLAENKVTFRYKLAKELLDRVFNILRTLKFSVFFYSWKLIFTFKIQGTTMLSAVICLFLCLDLFRKPNKVFV